MTIHFICRGNTFRSIIAEAYMKSLELPGISVLSSGTCASQYRESNAANFQKTLALLAKHGIQQFAKDHHADDLNQDLLDKSDLVICLNKIAHDEATGSFDLPSNALVWDVTDLGEEGRIATTEAQRRAFSEDVYAEIAKNIDDLVSLQRLGSR